LRPEGLVYLRPKFQAIRESNRNLDQVTENQRVQLWSATYWKDGDRGRNRTFNLQIKSQVRLCHPCSGNSQRNNNLQESCAHREYLSSAWNVGHV